METGPEAVCAPGMGWEWKEQQASWDVVESQWGLTCSFPKL